jgi:hypothetical protein
MLALPAPIAGDVPPTPLDLRSHSDITPRGSSYTATSVPAHGTILLKLTGS